MNFISQYIAPTKKTSQTNGFRQSTCPANIAESNFESPASASNRCITSARMTHARKAWEYKTRLTLLGVLFRHCGRASTARKAGPPILGYGSLILKGLKMADTTEMLPPGCGYQGYEFGASYPDSLCQGGRLYDADACDGDFLYEPCDYIPCPMCHPWQYIKWRADYNASGFFWEDLKGWYYAVRLTFDIWKNRKMGTEPWKRK